MHQSNQSHGAAIIKQCNLVFVAATVMLVISLGLTGGCSGRVCSGFEVKPRSDQAAADITQADEPQGNTSIAGE